ncbi:putative calcium-binding protein CML45 [Castanea sativa]|uniref:putative calcium-binding protein CML45 n=1 Tax=Castanea sativa TaxID=21020 RepID=UPI003F651F11
MVVTDTNLSIRILYWVVEIHSFFSKFHLYLENLVANALTRWKFWTKLAMNEKLLEDEKLSESDVKKVMDELGVAYNPDSDIIDQERIGAHELSQLFDGEQPSLEEVKEAFEVFDENKDGFIGATELQRVLRSLGLKEGSEVEECTKMIRAVDENGDGLIDFNEFVMFMENCSF